MFNQRAHSARFIGIDLGNLSAMYLNNAIKNQLYISMLLYFNRFCIMQQQSRCYEISAAKYILFVGHLWYNLRVCLLLQIYYFLQFSSFYAFYKVQILNQLTMGKIYFQNIPNNNNNLLFVTFALEKYQIHLVYKY